MRHIDKKLGKVIDEGGEYLAELSVCLGKYEGTEHQLNITPKGVLKYIIRETRPNDAGQKDGRVDHHAQLSLTQQVRDRIRAIWFGESPQAPYGVGFL